MKEFDFIHILDIINCLIDFEQGEINEINKEGLYTIVNISNQDFKILYKNVEIFNFNKNRLTLKNYKFLKEQGCTKKNIKTIIMVILNEFKNAHLDIFHTLKYNIFDF